MVKMKKEEVEELLEKYPHLKKYVESIKHKMDDPIFYLTLPFETRDEEHPNLIYQPEIWMKEDTMPLNQS